MKEGLKTIIFYTMSTLRNLIVKLLDNNVSNYRKITEIENN